MKDNRNPVPGITHGLIHPLIWIACLAPLDLQMQVFMGGNHIRRLCPASELLATPGLPAKDGGPFLGCVPLTPGTFVTASHCFHLTVRNVPMNAPVAKGNRYRMFLE